MITGKIKYITNRKKSFEKKKYKERDKDDSKQGRGSGNRREADSKWENEGDKLPHGTTHKDIMEIEMLHAG